MDTLPSVDLYALLGVHTQATTREIICAYRRIALHCHPDINQGDSKKNEIFRLSTMAYKILVDEKKRSTYDRRRKPSFIHKIIRPFITESTIHKSESIRTSSIG